MSINLKPCPMCGSPAKFVRMTDHHGDYFTLGCSHKGCLLFDLVMDCPSEEGEIDFCLRWNRRFKETVTAENGRLRMEIERLRQLIREWGMGIAANAGPQFPNLKPIFDEMLEEIE